MDEILYEKITKKKEFSRIPKKDVERVFSRFDKGNYLEEEKIKLTREILMKAYSVFASQKLLNIRDKDLEWFLKRHSSTRERFDFYIELYKRLFKKDKLKFTILDLGAGVNGLSYCFFPKNLKIDYMGIEAIGQLVDLSNYYFSKNKLKNYFLIHESLFELDKIKKHLKKIKGAKVVFLFKTLDSLEMIERNYSKKLLNEIIPLVDKVIISFATRSLIKKEKFRANKKWLVEFIKNNFRILDDFELGNERYLVFSKNEKFIYL
jgi:hypothetical protein